MKNRILIVEDDHAISDAVALNMQFVGYGYAVFDDGKKAADSLADDHAFDLALLDIMLPGIVGFELFSYMEKYNIPVIYMTAKTDSASEIKGLMDGAEDYIVKTLRCTHAHGAHRKGIKAHRQAEHGLPSSGH